MRQMIIAMALLAVACGSKGPEKKSYTLFWTAQKQPPGGIPVTITLPPTISEAEVDAMGSPSFKLAGTDSPLPQMSVVAIPCPSGDCTEKAVALQYSSEELAAAKSETLGAGRRWIAWDGTVPSSTRRRVHARLFAHHPASNSMVMCVAILLGSDADKLGDVRKACESLTI